MNKELVHQHVCDFLQNKINQLQQILDDICSATAEDSKSSAGDKHETSTSMAQLEQEKLSNQIKEYLNQRDGLYKIDASKKHSSIELGSLVLTNKGWFYFSTGLGSIKMDEFSVFCLGLHSPIGQLLKGKKQGNKVIFNASETSILEIY